MINAKDLEITELFRENGELWYENTKLKEKIFKTIEYIKENACYGIQEKCCLDDLNYNECDELLKILGDKENEES